MTISTISTLPAAPSRTTDTPANFRTKADAFTDGMVDLVPELNTSIGQMNTDIATVNSQYAAVVAAAAQVSADADATQDAYQALALASLTELTGTSSSSVSVGTGSKAFTASTGKLWFAGMSIFVRDAASASNYMVGEVASYNASTGALTVTVYVTGGAGTINSWLIYPSGHRYDDTWSTIATATTTSGTTATFSNIPQIYDDLLLVFLGVSHNSGSNQTFRIELSDDGSNWTTATTVSASVAASATMYGGVFIPGYRQAAGVVLPGVSNLASDRTADEATITHPRWRIAAGIAHIRISPAGGSFDAGSIVLKGR